MVSYWLRDCKTVICFWVGFLVDEINRVNDLFGRDDHLTACCVLMVMVGEDFVIALDRYWKRWAATAPGGRQLRCCRRQEERTQVVELAGNSRFVERTETPARSLAFRSGKVAHLPIFWNSFMHLPFLLWIVKLILIKKCELATDSQTENRSVFKTVKNRSIN
jgi:hypothetical protein